MDKNEIIKLLHEATKEFVGEIVKSGKSPDEVMLTFKPILIKKLFPSTFLVTLEMPAPGSATLLDVTSLIETELPGSTVVHIEKLEIKQ